MDFEQNSILIQPYSMETQENPNNSQEDGVLVVEHGRTGVMGAKDHVLVIGFNP